MLRWLAQEKCSLATANSAFSRASRLTFARYTTNLLAAAKSYCNNEFY
jgi:hypothetical protein